MTTPAKINSMEALLASLEGKTLTLRRGDFITGKIILITPTDIVLDLGSKAEGFLSKRDFGRDQLANIKIGDEMQAYVIIPENESGQVILSLQKQTTSTQSGFASPGAKRWHKFTEAIRSRTRLIGQVTEANKGGLIVEVDGIRGFLPSSQISFKNIGNVEKMMNQEVEVTVIEVDQSANRLIFSQRGELSSETRKKLAEYKPGDNVKGKVVAVLPFGVFLEVGDLEGFVFKSESSWERVDDLGKLFKASEEIDAQVLSIDEDFGRLNLSVKALAEDPFAKLSQKYPPDTVASGTVLDITSSGVIVKVGEVEGFLPSSKVDPGTNYQVGQQIEVMVDSVDKVRRKIILAPFLTSTKGLIYK